MRNIFSDAANTIRSYVSLPFVWIMMADAAVADSFEIVTSDKNFRSKMKVSGCLPDLSGVESLVVNSFKKLDLHRVSSNPQMNYPLKKVLATWCFQPVTVYGNGDKAVFIDEYKLLSSVLHMYSDDQFNKTCISAGVLPYTFLISHFMMELMQCRRGGYYYLPEWIYWTGLITVSLLGAGLFMGSQFPFIDGSEVGADQETLAAVAVGVGMTAGVGYSALMRMYRLFCLEPDESDDKDEKDEEDSMAEHLLGGGDKKRGSERGKSTSCYA